MAPKVQLATKQELEELRRLLRSAGFLPGETAVNPSAHASTHLPGGSDPLSSASLALISEQTPSGTGTVTFSSIPGTYRHLRIDFTARGTQTATSTVVNLQFNSDSGSNYDGERGLFTTTATLAEQLGATSVNAILVPAATATSNYAASGVIDLPYYADTTFYKVFLARMHYLLAQTTTNVQTRFFNGIWRSTSAITQIDLILNSGNYVSGSKFSLYGVA